MVDVWPAITRTSVPNWEFEVEFAGGAMVVLGYLLWWIMTGSILVLVVVFTKYG